MRLFVFKKRLNNHGNVVLGMGAGLAMLAIGSAVYLISNQLTLGRKVISNKIDSIYANESSVTRIGQAVAAGAILCPAPSGSGTVEPCRWSTQPNLAPDKFGVQDVEVAGEKLILGMRTCTPAKGSGVAGCQYLDTKAEVKLLSLQELMDKGELSDRRGADDTDKFAVYSKVTAMYRTSSGAKKQYKTTAIMRRPRSILKIIPGTAQCSPTCATVSGGSRLDPICYGPIEIPTDADTTADVSGMRIRNEGPGHVYKFQIQRSFAQSMAAGNGGTDFSVNSDPVIVYDSEKGLAPGEEVEISDSALPCPNEFIYTSSTVAVAGGGGSVTSVSRGHNSRPSGRASYSFVGETLDPPSAVSIEGGSVLTPARRTHTHTTTFIPIVVTGQN